MGDGKSSGSQQVDTYYLRRAVRDVGELVTQLARDTAAFKSGMRNYSLSTLDHVAAERRRRAHGEDYDKSAADPKNLQHVGANSNWLNPFGNFDEADNLQGHVDQAHTAAIQDGDSLGQALVRLKGALRRAADLYDGNEDKNSTISKQVMQRLLTGASTGATAGKADL